MKYITYTVTLLISLFLLSSCIKENDEPNDGIEVVVGDKVPYFSVEDGKGNTFKSDDFKGKRSILVLFNTTCPDCKAAKPIIEAAWQELKKEKGYQVVAIARGETGDDYWTDPDIQVFPDPQKIIYNKFANSYIPRIYLIDNDGIVQWIAVEKLGSTTAADLVSLVRFLP
ncbi:thiol-disulfide isomerase/thioredoxin [Parabacteroides sp. PFB2-10]|uniref:TlpA family protein disulfide reductase n=1 Tax=Parabacteroides sp. PFB2-10 TaxID=1742405 RepID=UPI0024746540|nr:TlpA disulfide reductase family protein [Parabacteroides sp. PFB2-10]MDH6311808.1 thiol-disulfide isomerase/thioredoxin [Parabacteroides sp. PFB2-10]